LPTLYRRLFQNPKIAEAEVTLRKADAIVKASYDAVETRLFAKPLAEFRAKYREVVAAARAVDEAEAAREEAREDLASGKAVLLGAVDEFIGSSKNAVSGFRLTTPEEFAALKFRPLLAVLGELLDWRVRFRAPKFGKAERACFSALRVRKRAAERLLRRTPVRKAGDAVQLAEEAFDELLPELEALQEPLRAAMADAKAGVEKYGRISRGLTRMARLFVLVLLGLIDWIRRFVRDRVPGVGRRIALYTATGAAVVAVSAAVVHRERRPVAQPAARVLMP
jgi:hypothetical protein